MNTKNNNHDTATIGRSQIINAVREMMPKRALTDNEARFVAERQANRLSTLLNLSGPVVDLEPIAGLPKIEVKLRGGLPVSGFSEWSRGRWVIAINADDHVTRRRFTFAHEIKHVIDHTFVDTIYVGSDGKPSHKRIENICDYFAACLLIPRVAVKSMWGMGHQRTDDLAAYFGVSKAAMGLRLNQLGLTSSRKRCGQPTFRYYRASRPSFSGVLAQGSGVCS